MNAAGAVRNTEARKNSRAARKNQRQNSKVRGKFREVKDNLGKNITKGFPIYCLNAAVSLLHLGAMLIGRDLTRCADWSMSAI